MKKKAMHKKEALLLETLLASIFKSTRGSWGAFGASDLGC